MRLYFGDNYPEHPSRLYRALSGFRVSQVKVLVIGTCSIHVLVSDFPDSGILCKKWVALMEG